MTDAERKEALERLKELRMDVEHGTRWDLPAGSYVLTPSAAGHLTVQHASDVLWTISELEARLRPPDPFKGERAVPKYSAITRALAGLKLDPNHFRAALLASGALHARWTLSSATSSISVQAVAEASAWADGRESAGGASGLRVVTGKAVAWDGRPSAARPLFLVAVVQDPAAFGKELWKVGRTLLVQSS